MVGYEVGNKQRLLFYCFDFVIASEEFDTADDCLD